MKPTAFITGLSALALAASASAADVTLYITGATAFRSAALTAIRAKYLAGNGSISFKYAHDAAVGSLTSSTRSIFKGNFQGNTGTTTIICCFSGSVEGIRSLKLIPGTTPGTTDTTPPTYYNPADAEFAAAANGTTSSNAEYAGATLAALTMTPAALATVSDVAFSDVNTPSTPYSLGTLTTDKAGVIVFTMLANEGSTISNVTSQQFRALLTQGFQPKSLFTGNALDTSYVYAMGRNDGSGTRTTALAETGYGITKTVNQYIVNAPAGVPAITGNTITKLQLVPVGPFSSPAVFAGLTVPQQDAETIANANASTVWGQNSAGNGGYGSGGGLVTPMGLTTANVQVLDSDGTTELAAAAPIDLLTWLSVSDASTAKNNGAVVCGYNGVSLDLGTVTVRTGVKATTLTAGTRYKITVLGTTDFVAQFGASSNTVGTVFVASTKGVAGSGTGEVSIESYSLSANDLTKVRNGSYTAWGYERMFKTANVTGSKLTVYNAILAAIPANIGTAGIANDALMTVARDGDGDLVAPVN